MRRWAIDAADRFGHALARLALVLALAGQVVAPASATPAAPLAPQARAIVAAFGADALCLAGGPEQPGADHSTACVACPTHCAGATALAPRATAPALPAAMAGRVAPAATAPPAASRPRSDQTAHGPPARPT